MSSLKSITARHPVMRFRGSIAIFVLILCVAAVSCQSQQPGAPAGNAAPGEIAPDFSLRDITGRTVSLSEFAGKVVLLEFWATWCPPCLESIPELNALQDKYRESGFVILAISLDEGPGLEEMLGDFSREYMINYQILLGEPDVTRSYGVMSIPMTFIIDRKGRIVSSFMGARDDFARSVSEKIDSLI